MKEENLPLKEKEALILSYYRMVVRYLSVFGIEESLMEDAVQETYMEAFASLPSLRQPESAQYWILTIARRVGLRFLRKSKKLSLKECYFDDCVVKSDYDADIFRDEQLDRLIARFESQRLCDCLKRLSEKERRVLLLYYVYEHKLSEIAVITGIPLNSVKSICRRAKMKLKDMYEEEGGRIR